MTYAETTDHVHYATIRPAHAPPDDRRVCLAAGPYATRQEAEAVVDAVRALDFRDYREAPWLASGTTRVTLKRGRSAPVGKFNHLLAA
jgi:hypothetical protein